MTAKNTPGHTEDNHDGIHSGRLQVRLSVLLVVAAAALVAWPLLNLSRNYRLAIGRGEGADELVTAASMGDLASVRRALDEGVPADTLYNGCTALQVTDDPAVVRALLEHGANPSVWCCHRSPLISAATTGHLEITDLLLKAGADPNEREAGYPSALDAARMWRHDDVAQLLLQYGAREDQDSASR